MKKIVLLIGLILILTGCTPQPPGQLIVINSESNSSGSIIENNITNNYNYTNNITQITNFTLSNTSFACSGANEYVYNYSIINGVATGLCAADSTGITSETDPIATIGVAELNSSKLNISDQRYNDTTYINTVANNLQTNISSVNATVTAQTTQINNLYANVTSINSSVNARIDNLNITKLNATDQRYNNTILINGVNSTSNIQGLGFLTFSQIISGIGNWSLENSTIRTLINAKQPSFANSSTQCSGTDKLVNITSLNGLITGTCATDQTGGAGAGDGSGGWTNTTTNTNTTLHTQVLNNYLNVTNTGQAQLWLQGTSAKVTYQETDDGMWTMLLSGGNFYFKQENAYNRGFFVRGNDNVDRLDVALSTNVTTIRTNLTVTGLNAASCDLKASTSGQVYCGTDATGAGSTPPVKFVNVVAGAVTDTNQPAAARAFGNTYYFIYTNLTDYTEFRFGVARAATNGAAASVIYPKYKTGTCNTLTESSWTNISSSNPYLSTTTANLVQSSTYYTIVAGALADVCIGFFTSGGDGVLDPQFRNIWMEFK